MNKKYDDRARKVVQLANQEAQRFNHDEIDSEHILIGLVKEGSGVAANVLKNLDVDLRKIRLDVEKKIQSGPEMVVTPKWSQRADGILNSAEELARKTLSWRTGTDRGTDEIGTEHILIALLSVQEGVAYQVLTELGLKRDDVYKETELLLEPLHHRETPKPVDFLLDPGTASPEEIAELYYEISTLYRMMGGTGVRFTVTDCRLPEMSEGIL